MALKAEIESREADCGSVQDYVALAGTALEDPADPDYAQQLLQQAADLAQFPVDHVCVAEAALSAGLTDLAADAFQQAEEFCMEGSEFAAVAVSLARHTDQKDRARGLFERAVEDAGSPQQMLALAARAKTDLDDDRLAASLLEKVKNKLSGLDEFKALAQSLLEGQDAQGARLLYAQAADLAEDIPGTVAYAAGLIELFDDREAVRELFAGLEGDCMFPGQFVALATGYQSLLDDVDKAAELLEQGKEFAMSGEENLDLANGYAALLGDQATALALYCTALDDLSSKDDLIRLAGDMAAHLDDKAQAARAYEKAESKVTDPNDLARLAKAVNDTLGDKGLAAAIFERATERIDQPNDLLRLGGEILSTLNDPAAAAGVYARALDRIEEYPQLQRLLDLLADGFEDPALAQAAVDKALRIGDGTLVLIDVAQRSRRMQLEPTITARALDLAEEAVNSLDEVRKLNDAVAQLAADDAGRIQRVAAKLAKREASQAKYVAFQDREKRLSRANEFIELARDVRTDLDDPFYAAQLLEKADEILAAGRFDLQLTSDLVAAVDELVDDHDWVERLLEVAADKVGYFVQMRTLGQTAAALSDRAFGTQWTRALYGRWEQRLASADRVSPQELGKFANAVYSDLGDPDWALTLLAQAQARATRPLDLAWLGRHARGWGRDELAGRCYEAAAAACRDAADVARLARQLDEFGEPADLRRVLYAQGGERLSEPTARLRWAEGIVREFDDTAWAGEVYDQLAGSFATPQARSVYDYSREVWLGRR